MTKLTNAEKDKLDNTCGNLRVTKLGTHVKSLEDFVNEGALATRANDVTSAINELYGMIVNNECAEIQIPPPGFFTIFGNDEDGKLYVYYNDEDNPPVFRHVETEGELEGTLYLYIADPEGENHFEMEIGHYIAVRHLDNYYTKAEIDAGYAIKDHAVNASTYGLGSTSKFGHVKTINGLTQASHADGLALSAYQGKVLKTAVDEKVVTVEKQSTAESGYSATYIVKQNNAQVGVKINIPKDFLVKSTSVKTCTTANQPVNGYEVGDIYIDWVVNSKDNTATDEHLYLRAKDIGSYPPDEVTLTIVNNQFKIKDGGVGSTQLASDSVLTAKIKDANVTTAKIKDANVTTAKIKDGNVTTAKIADSNVTTAKIADGAVTNDKVTSITKNKISDFSHAHGNLQNDGKVGTTDNASKNVVTDANGKITIEAKPTVPTANSTATNIKMDGTQSAGSLSTFAKADHVHPTDTSRASTATATQSANGLMSSTDKTKLDGIATGANKITVDSSLSSTSTNPVQNKIINAKISTLATKEEVDDIIAGDIDLTGYVKDTDSRLSDSRTPKSHTHGNISNDGVISNAASKNVVTDANGKITTEAKPTIDTDLSSSSTNAVQNKAVNTALSGKAPNSHASTATSYGVGTSDKYGHNKIIDDASKSSLTNGESLSAHMGYILNNQDVEYIEGTHGTTATATWTGTCTKLRKLEKGTKIFFKLTSAGASNVTLNLTLADGTTTGAKNVFFNNTTRLSTQYGINAIISLVYDGTQWRVVDPYTNTNYYERLTNFVQCTAGEALATQIIAGAKSDGKYYKIASGLVLDIRHPIIWLGAAIAKDANSNNVFGVYNAVNLQTTLANKTVTAYKKVYIKGTLSKSSFTVHSDIFVSDDNLTDGFYYIPIGVSYSTTQIRFNTINQEVYKYTTANGLMPVGFSYNDLVDIPSTFPPSSHTHTKSQITDFPTTMTPSSHSHGNITDDGAIGSTPNKPIITTTSGKLTTGSFGTTANTFCQGNDPRLSDARVPTNHSHVGEIERFTIASDTYLDVNYETGMAIFTWWTRSIAVTGANVWDTIWTLPTLNGYRFCSATGYFYGSGSLAMNPNVKMYIRITPGGTVDVYSSIAQTEIPIEAGQLVFMFDLKEV